MVMGAGCTSENNVIRASTASLQDNEKIPYKILIVGPSDAGKTFLLYSWVLGSDGVHTTKPTEEFNVETVKTKSGMSFMMWDITGNASFRHHRKRKFFEGTQGLVYVFDGSKDSEPVKEELKLFLQEKVLLHVPVVIVLNRVDDGDNLEDQIILDQLGIESHLVNRTWCISRVRHKSQTDIDSTLSDIQRVMSL